MRLHKRATIALLLGVAMGTTPAPSYAQPRGSLVTDHIYEASINYNLDPNYMVRVAKCESQLNPAITSRNGLYHGLYQYSWTTWRSFSYQAGYGGYSPYNVEAAAQTTAWAFAHGYAYHWPRCRYA